MQIELQNIGKKFNKDWVFRNLNYSFKIGNSYAITGHNGSGKSTLLQIISGFVMPSEGKVVCSNFDNKTLYQQMVMAAPYLELVEEMTALEFLQFHQQFKQFIGSISLQQILEQVNLLKAADKQIRYFSSGMRQRLKLAQAFFSDTKILLLDEPTSNLDKQGISLYLELIKQYSSERLVIICSNDEAEYSFCSNKILIGTSSN